MIGIWTSMLIMSRVTLAVSANSSCVLTIVAIAFLAVLLALPRSVSGIEVRSVVQPIAPKVGFALLSIHGPELFP